MKAEDITKAVEYKQGHFNMVQYLLKEKPNWSKLFMTRRLERHQLNIQKTMNK